MYIWDLEEHKAGDVYIYTYACVYLYMPYLCLCHLKMGWWFSVGVYIFYITF